MAKALSAQRVVFDRRLYVHSDLADVGAKQWRDYLVGLEARGGDTDPVAARMTIGPQHDSCWVVACIVGVAVCDASTGAAAREWGRIHLTPVVEGMFETAMLGDDSGNMMPATSRSWRVGGCGRCGRACGLPPLPVTASAWDSRGRQTRSRPPGRGLRYPGAADAHAINARAGPSSRCASSQSFGKLLGEFWKFQKNKALGFA